MGVLQDNPQRPAQIGLSDLVDIDAVIADLAVRNVVKAVDEVGDGSLAGAGGAYKGNLLARGGIQLDVVQDNLALFIAEVHIVKGDVPFQLLIGDGPVCLMRMLPGPEVGAFLRFGQGAVRFLPDIHQGDISVVLLRLLVHQVEDSLGACHCHHNAVELLADLAHRLGGVLIGVRKDTSVPRVSPR